MSPLIRIRKFSVLLWVDTCLFVDRRVTEETVLRHKTNFLYTVPYSLLSTFLYNPGHRIDYSFRRDFVEV